MRFFHSPSIHKNDPSVVKKRPVVLPKVTCRFLKNNPSFINEQRAKNGDVAKTSFKARGMGKEV